MPRQPSEIAMPPSDTTTNSTPSRVATDRRWSRKVQKRLPIQLTKIATVVEITFARTGPACTVVRPEHGGAQDVEEHGVDHEPDCADHAEPRQLGDESPHGASGDP